MGRIFGKLLATTIFLPLFAQAALSSSDTQAIRPYELPSGHLVRAHLDKLFKKSRFIKNIETLDRAGFTFPGPRKHTGLIVAKHAKTPGYIYKIYTDVQEFYKREPEYRLWLLRIEGATRIRNYVDRHQWNDHFKVPQKWIYIIPKGTARADGYYEKQTILVEEDMGLLSEKKNLQVWKGDSISKTLLEQVYHIITDLGLRDCAKPDNIPFSLDGRIAFIDTQTFDEPPIPYQRLTHYLNKSNQKYWKSLTK